MTLRRSLHVLRRWRGLVLATFLIGVGVGWVSAPGSAASATVFEATHTMILDPSAPDRTVINRAAVLATLGAVPDRVAARLGLPPESVRAMVSAGTREALGQLLITGSSRDRVQAEAVANLTAEELVSEFGGAGAPLRTLERAVATRVTTDVLGPRSRPSRAFMLGAFGLVLGMGAAFGIERFDPRIGSKRAAEEALGLAVIAEIPELVRPGDEPLMITSAPAPPLLLERFRYVGSFLLANAAPNGAAAGDGPVVVVAAADAGADPTPTTVAHLAAALGELGRSVLAVSADLRGSRLHGFFGRPLEPGLADVLAGRTVLDGVDLATPVRGVRLLPAGETVDNPAPLLERIGEILGETRRLADVVLVDAPPLLTVSDAAQVARHADGVLLVIRAGHTTSRAAARAVELLERLDIRLLGAILVGPPSATAARRAAPRPFR